MIMSEIGQLLYLMLPIVLAGVLNMVFVKSNVLNQFKIPMDSGRHFRDGKRLLGDNKTWKGFWGMVFLTAVCTSLFHLLDMVSVTAEQLSLFPYDEWYFPLESFIYGAIFGLGYVLAELPNSFIKRRIDIPPGKNERGVKGVLFLIIDQADSVIGCVMIMPLFYVPTLIDAIAIIILATVLHLVINFILYLVGLKHQPA